MTDVYFTTFSDVGAENSTALLLSPPWSSNVTTAAAAGAAAAVGGAGGGAAGGVGAAAGGAAVGVAVGAPVRHGAAGTVLIVAPSMDAIRADLKWGFLLHVYGFACLFCVLAFYAFFSILNLRSLISARPFMSTINGFLCLLGASRAVCLFIDPYNVKESMPKVIGSVLWDVGFPSVTSAFCLIQLAFLQLTQLNLGPEKLRRKSCLSLIITAHFTFVVGADLGLGFQEHFLIVKYAVQTVFLCWGVFICCMFLYGGYRVMALLRDMPGSLLSREPPDRSHEGIMQLAMLAPYNNLASSVAAALVPTLLTPKIRITDENDQTVSYGSDSASLTAPHSHGLDDEGSSELCGTSSLLLERGASASASGRSGRSGRSASPEGRGARGRSPVLPAVTVRPPTPTAGPASRRPSTFSSFSRRGSDADPASSRRGSACSVYSQRGESLSRRGSDVSRRSFGGGAQLPDLCCDPDAALADCDADCGGLALVSPTASSFARQNSWPQPQPQAGGAPAPGSVTTGDLRAAAAAAGHSPRGSLRRSRSHSRAHAHGADASEDEVTAETSLLPQRSASARRHDKTSSSDLTLQSILTHIAYVNRSPGSACASPLRAEGAGALAAAAAGCSRKGQLQKVLHVTYATALLGVVLCVADMGRLYGPYGLSAATRTQFRSGEAADAERSVNGQYPRPWPWFCFQTLCRALEFAMGCAMANITKQPVNSRHQLLQQQHAYSLRFKPRDSLYI